MLSGLQVLFPVVGYRVFRSRSLEVDKTVRHKFPIAQRPGQVGIGLRIHFVVCKSCCRFVYAVSVPLSASLCLVVDAMCDIVSTSRNTHRSSGWRQTTTPSQLIGTPLPMMPPLCPPSVSSRKSPTQHMLFVCLMSDCASVGATLFELCDVFQNTTKLSGVFSILH